MVLVIKIRNDIRVSDDTSKIYFAPNYFEAQNKIESIYNISTDFAPFNEFFESMNSNFCPSEVHSLYYLTDSITIADILIAENVPKPYTTSAEIQNKENIKTDNLLNYFGFVIENKPTITQLKELNTLREKGIVTKYWLEGTPEINFKEDPKASFTRTINKDYADGLKFMNLEKRGLGVTIIDFEVSATDNLTKLRKSDYLNQLLLKNDKTKSFSLIEDKGLDLTHQKQTLVTIFGKTPIDMPKIPKVEGIAPDATLMVCSLKPLPPEKHFAKVRDFLIELRRQNIENAILLFEFTLPATDKLEYPICIFDDLAGHLDALTKVKNFISVGGMGNSREGINFDEAKNMPWNLKNSKDSQYTYRSLENNKSLILVGATKKVKDKFVVEEGTNSSKFADAFLYTNFYVGNQNEKNLQATTIFQGTSAATAVATGIIAYLLGESIKKGKIITTKVIKEIFKSNFMRNYPNEIINPTTLETLLKTI